jgi:phage portal protein BeeE
MPACGSSPRARRCCRSRCFASDARGKRTLVTDHWVYRLFARRPNAFQNPFEFREMLQGHLALRGNAYARIIDNGRGEVTDLHPAAPRPHDGSSVLDNGQPGAIACKQRERRPNDGSHARPGVPRARPVE